MIDAYYWPTPNGWKLSIALEEMGLDYNVIPINIGKGDQFKPEFLKVSPNNRIPAIVDHDPPGGGEPISVFETGAILLYLANKTGMFYPEDLRKRTQVHEWLMWQIGGLGPMIGQAGHFKLYHSEKIQYAIDRYHSEMLRLYGVLDKRLEGREYIVDDFSIADIALACQLVNLRHTGARIDSAKWPALAAYEARYDRATGPKRVAGALDV